MRALARMLKSKT